MSDENETNEEETLTIKRDDYDNFIKNSYQNGLEDGKAGIKQTVLDSLKNHCFTKFFNHEDDVAKEVRNIYKSFEQQL